MTKRVSDINLPIDISARDYWLEEPGVVRSINHEFEDLSVHFDRQQVDSLLADEARLLGPWFGGKGNLKKFEALCEKEGFLGGFLFAGLADPGTAGAIAALNLMGCPTFWSCNGEHEDRFDKSQSSPHVGFLARAAMVPKLIAAAQVAKVGLIGGEEGIEVFAASRRGLHDFAVALLANIPDSFEAPTESFLSPDDE